MPSNGSAKRSPTADHELELGLRVLMTRSFLREEPPVFTTALLVEPRRSAHVGA
jgi:hypothetical protein